MGLFEKIGRQVEQFKQSAEAVAEEQAEFECRACGERFFVERETCPECGSEDVVTRFEESEADGPGAEADEPAEADGPDRNAMDEGAEETTGPADDDSGDEEAAGPVDDDSDDSGNSDDEAATETADDDGDHGDDATATQ